MKTERQKRNGAKRTEEMMMSKKTTTTAKHKEQMSCICQMYYLFEVVQGANEWQRLN